MVLVPESRKARLSGQSDHTLIIRLLFSRELAGFRLHSDEKGWINRENNYQSAGHWRSSGSCFGLYAGTVTTMGAVATGLVILLVLLLILPRIRKGRNIK